MKTERLIVDGADPQSAADRDALARAAHLLRRGGLVAFPTETVYGLGAHALDATAVGRIFRAKGRPAHDPLIVHIAHAALLPTVAAHVPARAQALLDRFWPGPLTLVLPRHPAVPDAVTAGGPTVAVRAPRHPVAQALLRTAGLPVAAPSANLFSHTSPTTADHVAADLDGRIELILDGGPTTIGLESTVLSVLELDAGEPAVILRPGGVPLEALQAVLGADWVVESPTASRAAVGAEAGAPLASPGLLDRHYAPRTPLLLIVGGAEDAQTVLARTALEAHARGERPVVLAYDDDLPVLVAAQDAGCILLPLGPVMAPDVVARRLYGALRDADAMGGGLLLARELPGSGLAAAVRDRLRRAADRLLRAESAAQDAGTP